ncbi:MAG: amidohydrolase [Acidobacteriota bacterium]|nr:amidohydrolase [Acidobacteriota bacterium]
MHRLLVLAALLTTALVASPRPAPPDRIFVNARIWTGDDAKPQAEALAIAGDRLVGVGSDAEIRAMAGPNTEIVDLGGRRVVPGFNDAHWHLPSRRTADLAGAGSVDEIQARLREFALSLPADAWVTGRGWTPADFPSYTAHRRYLDAVFPDRPVLITDRDGHQALANGAALALARVTAATPDPQGGRVEHDAGGAPTGLLKESATSLVGRLVPAAGVDEVHRALIDELAKASSFGLTSLQIASGRASGATFDAMQRALANGELNVRLRVAVPFEREITGDELASYIALRDAHQGKMLTFGIAKGMLDGTVDAHTAAMLEPYAGSSDTGLPMWTAEELAQSVAAYDRAGLQIELHAIGDRAIRMALDAYERAARENGTSGRRHRIEHVEVPALEDLPRFRALGVIASTQAIFATPDAATLQNYAPALGPARASRSNAFKLFDDAGAVQAFGSDYPVFPMNVLRGIHAAVTRELPDGTPKGGWYSEHRIPVEAALRHFTRDAAYASFSEQEKGTLADGKLADFVVLTEDILSGPPERLLTAGVFMTVMGGRTTHR